MLELNTERFFRTFFAACFAQGLRHLIVSGDKYHLAFRGSVKYLRAKDKVGMFPYFIPSPFCGYYRELNEALVQLGQYETVYWLGSAWSIRLPSHTQVVLDKVPEPTRTVITQAAKIFCQFMRRHP